jgi:hypothetical protein
VLETRFCSPWTYNFHFLNIEGRNILGHNRSSRLASTHITMERLKELKDHTKAKTKGLLHIDSTEDHQQREQVSAISEVEKNPVFNPLNTINDKPATVGQKTSKIPGKVHQISHNILHPVSAVKEKTSSQLGVSEKPYLTDDANKDLLHAHKELETAKAAQSVEVGQGTDQMDGWNAEIDAVQDYHEKRRVAWTSSRFIHRVRVAGTKSLEFPVLSSYLTPGKSYNYEWNAWFRDLGLFIRQPRPEAQNYYELEEVVWNQDVFTEHVERILMASDPWQRVLLRVHRIWSWESPWRTATWFTICLAVWYYEFVAIFLYCYAVYNIFQHGKREATQVDLQESYDRIANPDAKVLTFGEMIERHGESDWLDPMIEAVGPTLQVRVNQIANAMEKLTNLYNWKEPHSTGLAIILFGLVAVCPTLIGTAFATRLWILLTILAFFTYYPLSIQFPDLYRVVGAMTWLTVVPTGSQTSFSYLRSQADALREKLHGQQETLGLRSGKDESDVPSQDKAGMAVSTEVDIFASNCKWNAKKGRLIASTTSIRFVRSTPRAVVWEHQYAEFVEVRKSAGESNGPNKIQSSLELIFKDDNKRIVEGLINRDEMFNVIIGFSGLEWEQLQPKTAPPAKGMVNIVKQKIQDKVGVDT